MMGALGIRKRFDPLSSIVYVVLHLGCLMTLFVGEVSLGLRILLGTYLIRIFALTAVYHRYFAHRAYRTSRVFQFILGVLGTLTLQRGPLWWAATHRMHHRNSDLPTDLHSPVYQGFFYSHSLWFLDRRNLTTDLSVVADLARYPELKLLDRKLYYLSIVIAYAGTLYGLFGALGIAWGFFVGTILTHHMTHWVQSMSHSFGGYRRFVTGDRSRNHWLIGIASLGEFHNNHHHRPGSARQGAVWWEFDAAYQILRLLALCGLVWSVRDLFTANARGGLLAAAVPVTSETDHPAGDGGG
jgi:stearoyl-CoA desaturase (delta-9 desaturase)